VPRRHPPHRLAGTQERAGDVDREHAFDPFGSDLVDAGVCLVDDAGVVDERRDSAEPIGGGEERGDAFRGSDVGLDGDAPHAAALARSDDRLGRLDGVLVADAD
jgi:hypothetical protein